MNLFMVMFVTSYDNLSYVQPKHRLILPDTARRARVNCSGGNPNILTQAYRHKK